MPVFNIYHSKSCQVGQGEHLWTTNDGSHSGQSKVILCKLRVTQWIQNGEDVQLSRFSCNGDVLSRVNMHLTWKAVPQPPWCAICKRGKFIQTWNILETFQDALGNGNGQTWSWHVQFWKSAEKGKDLKVDILRFCKYCMILNIPSYSGGVMKVDYYQHFLVVC